MSKTPASKQAKRKGIVLVTGATSGIGHLLVDKLLPNYEVRAILRQQPHQNEEWKNLPSGVKIYVTDLSSTDVANTKTLLEACAGVDTVFHIAAATANYQHYYKGERTTTNVIINTNVIGTENLLQAFSDSNPNKDIRFIYASSIAVYGHNRKGEILTEESEAKPQGAYGESKYMAEQVIKAFAAANKRLTYTTLRFGVLYGVGYYQKSFMRVFKMIKENRMRYIGNGENHLVLVNVNDAVAAMLEVMDTEKSANRTYNVSDGVAYTQKGLFKKAADLLDAEAPEKHIHPLLAVIGARTRGIDPDELSFIVSDRIVSIDKIKKELGFKPSVNSDKAFKALADEFLKTYS